MKGEYRKKFVQLPEPPCEEHKECIMLRPEVVTEEYQRIRESRISSICPVCGWEILPNGSVNTTQRD